MSRIISKPSTTFAKNFARIFGDKPKRRGKRARRFFVVRQGKTEELGRRLEKPRGVAQWPMRSFAFGVHPSQAAAEEKRMAALGVPTEFDRETGDAIFRSRGHRKRAVAVGSYGTMGDLDAGYGDPIPQEKLYGDE